MVKNPYIINVVKLLQFLAVLGVCFNHWSITLLKGSPSFFSDDTYRVAAIFGLTFLFFSSGFLSQYCFAGIQSPNDERILGADFIIGRYLRLLFPALSAVVFDYWIQGFADLSQTKDVIRALPFLVTLTQTWHYSVLGAASIAEPAGGSNMAWLGAHLFFLSIFFVLTVQFWNKIKSVRLLYTLLGICGALLVCIFNGLDYLTPQINIWAAQRYGSDIPTAYSLSSWLFEYNPYVHTPTFVAGILVARLSQISGPQILGRLLIAALLFALVINGIAAYAGWSIVLTVCAIFWVKNFNEKNRIYCHLVNSSGWLTRLGSCAYEVYVLHLVIYLMFTLTFMPGFNAHAVTMIAGRLLVVNALMLLLCLGLAELYFCKWQAYILRKLGYKNFEDIRYV